MSENNERINEREKRREKRRELLKSEDKARRENKKNNNVNADEDNSMKVIIRNIVAYSNYRKMISLTILNLIILAIVFFAAFKFYTQPVPPRYIPMSEDGKIIPDIPLDKPNMNDGAIMEFALNATRDINMYDYENWKVQLSKSMGYFTPQGWNSYLLEFEGSNILNSVKKNRMIVNMQPTEPPEIIRQGVLKSSNIYVWIVEIPVELKYISNIDSTTRTNPMKGVIQLTIIRTPTIENPNGVGIQIYNFDPSRTSIKN